MTIIDESLTAKGYTPAALVPAAFGQPRTIQGIVIHHWGLTGQTHDGVNNFFVNGPGQTSAHYVVSAGRINCLVSPEDAAWHCPGKNATHIGIECRPEATDGDYATVAELIRTLRAQYGPLPLSRHRDWYSTACPGVWDLDRLEALAQGSTIAPQSATITPVQEDDMATVPQNEWAHALEVLNSLADNAATKKDLAGIWKQSIDHRNPETGELEPGATTPETVLSYANWRLVTTLNTVAASARGIVDAVKAAPGEDAAKAAEDAYAAFADKLKGIKLTVTAGGE